MENGYPLEMWREAYVMLGTSAAALIGLLFVVTSLHLEEIANNPLYRLRARNSSFYLFVLVIEATLILIPQPNAFLGVELTAVVLFLLQMHLRNRYKLWSKNSELAKVGGFLIGTSHRYIASDLIGIAGGACLYGLSNSNWGMYLITASYVIFLGFVIMNCWNLMLGVGQAEKKTKTN